MKAWKPLLAIASIALLLAVFLLVRTIRRTPDVSTAESGDALKRDMTIILFVQSDFIGHLKSDREKLRHIWVDIMPKLFEQIRKDGKVKELFCYPLNSVTQDAHPFLEREVASLHRGKTPYRIEKNYEELLDTAKKNHWECLQKKDHCNLQDIIGSYSVLRRMKDHLADSRYIKAIYLSDLVHYDCAAGQTDPKIGLFHFARYFSVRAFSRQVEEGYLRRNGGRLRVAPFLIGGVEKIEFYSIALPPGEKREKVDTNALEILPDVWKTFFQKIGGTKVKLNLRGGKFSTIFKRG